MPTAQPDMTTPLSAAQVIQNAVADLAPNILTTILRDLLCGDAREMIAEASQTPQTAASMKTLAWGVVCVGGADEGQVSITLFVNQAGEGTITINHLNRRAQTTFKPVAAGPLHKAIHQTFAQLGITLDGRRMGGHE